MTLYNWNVDVPSSCKCIFSLSYPVDFTNTKFYQIKAMKYHHTEMHIIIILIPRRYRLPKTIIPSVHHNYGKHITKKRNNIIPIGSTKIPLITMMRNVNSKQYHGRIRCVIKNIVNYWMLMNNVVMNRTFAHSQKCFD